MLQPTAPGIEVKSIDNPGKEKSQKSSDSGGKKAREAGMTYESAQIGAIFSEIFQAGIPCEAISNLKVAQNKHIN